MKTTYYTIINGKSGASVKYAQSPTYEIKTLSETFSTSGEATKQFKELYGARAECLTEGAFQRKVETLAQRYQLELARLKAWNARVVQ